MSAFIQQMCSERMDSYAYPVRVFVGRPQDGKVVSNRISTTKYNVLTFLPKFLFYQYIQPNNIYYLLNAIAGYVVYVVAPISNVLPIIFVLVVAAIREIVEDVGRYMADREQNNAKFLIERCGYQQQVKSQDIRPGDVLILNNNYIVPCDCLLLHVDDDSGVVNVSTASLDGESNLKPRIALYEERVQYGKILTEAPNSNLHVFNGEYVDDERVNYFSLQNVLLKGVKLKSNYQCRAAVVFTGMNTRIIKCQTPPRVKNSKLNKRTYLLVLIQAIISAVLMFLLPVLSIARFDEYYTLPFLSEELYTKGAVYVYKMIIYFLILAYFLPISLFVTIEFCRVLEQFQFDLDKKLWSREMIRYLASNGPFKIKDTQFSDLSSVYRAATLKNTIVLENMAELDYVFTDKTGTLTKNQMKLNFLQDSSTVITFEAPQPLNEKYLANIVLLGICNTVQRQQETLTAESPDEVAFATGAALHGFKLLERQARVVRYEYGGKIYEFEILSVIPFSSTRKRMSIILREISDGLLPESIAAKKQPFVVTKGADSFILPRCLKTANGEAFTQISDRFSREGLRTLFFAHRALEYSFAQSWTRSFEKISQLSETSQSYISSTEYIESYLTLDFVTAVEDELQDDVKETLTAFRTAGLKTWMLTGDKTQTALNIAMTSGLSSHNAEIVWFTHEHMEEQGIVAQIDEMLRHHSRSDRNLLLIAEQAKDKFYLSKQQNIDLNLYYTNITVIIDGEVFTYLQEIYQIHKFYILAGAAQAVIGCRLSPADKATIVRNVKLINGKCTTLAIGDGNNDVPMIIEADIGAGVAGKEGLFACNNSDITFTEFSQLYRAVFVYARYYHARHSELVEFMIYKNSIIPFLSIFYSFFNKFTVNIFIDSLLLLMFNMIISLFPIFFQSITDRDVNENYLLAVPDLYKTNYNRQRPSLLFFYLRFAVCVLYALLIVYLTAAHFGYGLIDKNGYIGDMNCALQLSFIPFLISTSIEFCFYQNYYSIFTVAAYAAMLVITIGCMEFGNYSDSYGQTYIGSVHFLWGNLVYFCNVVVIVVICTVPGVLFKYLRQIYWPNTTDTMRQATMSNACTDVECPVALDLLYETIIREAEQ